MNRIILITGASSGIGLALTRRLIQNPHNHVIMACRDLEKSRRVAPKSDQDTASISHVELNLAKLQSVRNCAENLKEITGCSKIDTLVNNAGVFATGSVQEWRLKTVSSCTLVRTI